MAPEIVSGTEIARAIPDNAHILTIGMTLVGASESILSAIESRFLKEGHPFGLTLIHPAGQSDRTGGIQHLAHEGLVRRIIGSHWGLSPRWMELISEDAVIAYCMPQGQMTHWLRSMAAGLAGHLTPIGLGTFIDPRQEGGKMNKRTRDCPDLVRVVHVSDQEYLWFEAVPIDWVFVRGTQADTVGNIAAQEEPMKLELLPAVMAARRWRGRVVAQVKQIVDRGGIPPRQVEIPGVHVDYIVRAENPETQHRQTSSWVYDPNYSQIGVRDSNNDLSMPDNDGLDMRRVIGRRAIFELHAGDIINVGTGIPNDVIGPELYREGIHDTVTLTVESGIYGGVPVGGVDFGISKNPDALIEHPYQFDFYNGRGVDITFMGFAEIDEQGNVNATKFGKRATGAGGFIDITQCAQTVVFLGTFTANDLKTRIEGQHLQIINEGQVQKFVKRVQQISFNGPMARFRGQSVLAVTERAVFRLTTAGWVLEETAPGIDRDIDIIAHMGFRPIIAENLHTMASEIFSMGRLNLFKRITTNFRGGGNQ